MVFFIERNVYLAACNKYESNIAKGRDGTESEVSPMWRSYEVMVTAENFHTISWSWRQRAICSLFFLHIHGISPRITHAILCVPLNHYKSHLLRDNERADAKRDMGIARIRVDSCMNIKKTDVIIIENRKSNYLLQDRCGTGNERGLQGVGKDTRGLIAGIFHDFLPVGRQ